MLAHRVLSCALIAACLCLPTATQVIAADAKKTRPKIRKRVESAPKVLSPTGAKSALDPGRRHTAPMLQEHTNEAGQKVYWMKAAHFDIRRLVGGSNPLALPRAYWLTVYFWNTGGKPPLDAGTIRRGPDVGRPDQIDGVGDALASGGAVDAEDRLTAGPDEVDALGYGRATHGQRHPVERACESGGGDCEETAERDREADDDSVHGEPPCFGASFQPGASPFPRTGGTALRFIENTTIGQVSSSRRKRAQGPCVELDKSSHPFRGGWSQNARSQLTAPTPSP